MEGVIRVCRTKAAGSGASRGLEVLCDALERWGLAGVEPDRLLQGDAGRRFDATRLKAERAAEVAAAAARKLSPLTRHHSNEPDIRFVQGWPIEHTQGTHHKPFTIEVDLRFDPWGSEMFGFPDDDPDDVALTDAAHRKLAAVGARAAQSVGLRPDVDVDVSAHAYGDEADPVAVICFGVKDQTAAAGS